MRIIKSRNIKSNVKHFTSWNFEQMTKPTIIGLRLQLNSTLLSKKSFQTSIFFFFTKGSKLFIPNLSLKGISLLEKKKKQKKLDRTTKITWTICINLTVPRNFEQDRTDHFIGLVYVKVFLWLQDEHHLRSLLWTLGLRNLMCSGVCWMVA